MRRPWPLLVLILFYSLCCPFLAVASTSQQVDVKVRASVSGGITNFIVTYIDDHQINLSWTLTGDATNAMIRAKYGSFPTDIPDTFTAPSDGYLVYYGAAATATDFSVNLETSSWPIYYKAWAQKPDSNWYMSPASGWKEGQKLLLIVLVLIAMGLLTLAFVFKVPALFLASGAMWIVDGAYFVTVQSSTTWDLYYDVGLLCIGIAFICLIEMLVTGLSHPKEEEPEGDDDVTKQEKQWEKANAALRMPRFRRTRRW